MNVTAVYFSATDTAKKGAVAVAEGFGCPVAQVDVTLPGEYEKSFGRDDVVVFGAPCYGGRIPQVARERLEGMKGDGTPCVITMTYGNRDFDDGLVEMLDMVKANGFIPFAAAALIGQHTFGEIAVGRPNEADQNEDREFGKKAAEKLASGNVTEIEVPGSRPYKDGGKGGAFRPSTTDACVDCGMCASMCPTAAIADDNRTLDNDRCISCFRCIRVCPVGAKVMDSPQYAEFAPGFTERLKDPKENKYFI